MGQWVTGQVGQEGHPACKNRVLGWWCGCLSGARRRQLYDLHINSMTYTLSGSRESRVSTHDPLTHDQVSKIPRTGYFVAATMFDFESTSA